MTGLMLHLAVQSIGFPSSFATKHGSSLVHVLWQLLGGSQVSPVSSAPLPQLGVQSGSTFAFAPVGQQPSAAPDALGLQPLAAGPDPACGVLMPPTPVIGGMTATEAEAPAAIEPGPPATPALEPPAPTLLVLVLRLSEPPVAVPADVTVSELPALPPADWSAESEEVSSSGAHQPARL
jgi:hypothetical protein